MVLASVHEEWHGDMPVATVDGEIDASNAEELAERLRELLTNRSLGLVVDLRETTYLDSAGINVLFAVGDELAQRQQRLRIVVDPVTPIARMLEVTGLSRVYGTHRDVAAALTAG